MTGLCIDCDEPLPKHRKALCAACWRDGQSNYEDAMEEDEETIEVPLGDFAFWQSQMAHASARATNNPDHDGEAVHRACGQMLDVLRSYHGESEKDDAVRTRGRVPTFSDSLRESSKDRHLRGRVPTSPLGKALYEFCHEVDRVERQASGDVRVCVRGNEDDLDERISLHYEDDDG